MENKCIGTLMDYTIIHLIFQNILNSDDYLIEHFFRYFKTLLKTSLITIANQRIFKTT